MRAGITSSNDCYSSIPFTYGDETKLQPIRAIDLQKTFIREPLWAVEQIIPEGLSVLAAPPKSGKSFLVLQMSLAVSSGKPFLNQETLEGPVLYCALEDSWSRLVGRIGALLEHSVTIPEELHLLNELPRLDEGGLSVLGEWMGVNRPRMVIIDTWGKTKPTTNSRRENAYETDVRVVSEVKKLADCHECSILLVHHLRKGGAKDADWLESLSGSMGLGGTADAILSLVRNRGSKQAILKRSGRDLEIEDDLALEWLEPGWKFSGEASEVKMTEERKAIISLIREAKEPVNYGFVADVLGKNRNTTKSLMRKMLLAGVLRTTSRGEFTLSDEYLSKEL